MNKKAALFFLVSVLLIYAVLVTAIFLIFPLERLTCAQFYISLSFFLATNIAAALYMFSRLIKPQTDRAILFPPLLGAFSLWNALYLVAGVLFTVFMLRLGIVISVEIVLTVAYLIRMWSLCITTDYITEQREQRTADVRYLDSIQMEAALCADAASDRKVKLALQTLSDDIRYSDHISYGQLRDIESEILERVRALRAAVNSEPAEELLPKIDGVRILLRERNERCRMLK